jgi:hypothetical protein
MNATPAARSTGKSTSGCEATSRLEASQKLGVISIRRHHPTKHPEFVVKRPLYTLPQRGAGLGVYVG